MAVLVEVSRNVVLVVEVIVVDCVPIVTF